MSSLEEEIGHGCGEIEHLAMGEVKDEL